MEPTNDGAAAGEHGGKFSADAVFGSLDTGEFLLVHRSLILPEMIEQRKPLSPTARRAGWVACNILPHQVPPGDGSH